MSDERPVLLVVEDDKGLQKQMRWSFDQYEVIFADDHDSAIAAVRRSEPRVMTLDLGLPPTPDTTEQGLFKFLGPSLEGTDSESELGFTVFPVPWATLGWR